MLCLGVSRQRGRRGAIVAGWKMPFLEEFCCGSRAVAAPAGRRVPLALLAASNSHQGTILLSGKGLVTLIAVVLSG